MPQVRGDPCCHWVQNLHKKMRVSFWTAQPIFNVHKWSGRTSIPFLMAWTCMPPWMSNILNTKHVRLAQAKWLTKRAGNTSPVMGCIRINRDDGWSLTNKSSLVLQGSWPECRARSAEISPCPHGHTALRLPTKNAAHLWLWNRYKTKRPQWRIQNIQWGQSGVPGLLKLNTLHLWRRTVLGFQNLSCLGGSAAYFVISGPGI